MKIKNALIVILFVAFISISASVTTSLMEVKPAKPRYVTSAVMKANLAPEWIVRKTKEGYIVKTVVTTRDNPTHLAEVLIVMEKY